MSNDSQAEGDWAHLHRQLRRSARTLRRSDVPTTPGVYAWYRDGSAVYSGKATGASGLRGRIWEDHMRTGADLSRSSFRRNVCENLGIAPTSRTRLRPTQMTEAEIAPVNAWIRECDVGWIECQTPAAASELERKLHAELLPPLSKR